MNYIDKVDENVKKYFEVLEPDFPEWLNEYINAPRMQQQQYISITCGTIYSKMFHQNDYSSLDHSIAVALIIWHFTHDKKQTLSGLFHDIATPVFKHCIDFMNGDYMTQESTEDLTKKIIEESTEIMELLNRDNIKIEEVCDYHIYPIADNDTPKLSSDRLEYSLSNGHLRYEDITLEQVKEFYNDLEIETNEEGIQEMAFRSQEIGEEFVRRTCKYSVIYRNPENRYSMQFLADVMKNMSEQGFITVKDLYTMKESEVVDKIKKCTYKDINKKFDIWTNSESLNVSNEEPKGVYFVHHGAKIRYIDPLCKGMRMSKASETCKKLIEDNLNYDMNQYMYLNFIL